MAIDRSSQPQQSSQEGLEVRKSVLTATLESLLSRLPVDHLPDILNVRSLSVQVLQEEG